VTSNEDVDEAAARRRTAFHEAGHALVARALGLHVTEDRLALCLGELVRFAWRD
jgi:hypothetical protein